MDAGKHLKLFLNCDAKLNDLMNCEIVVVEMWCKIDVC